MKLIRDLKPIHWIIIAAIALGAFMTAPDKEVTKLAVLGKVAEIAGEESGAGPLGQASAASMMGMCVTFAPLIRSGAPASGDNTDRICRLILRMQQSTSVLNLGVANVALLSIQDAPTVVCLGAVYNVKCIAFGSGANFWQGGRPRTGVAEAPGLSRDSSRTLAELELDEMRSRPREAGKPFEFSATTKARQAEVAQLKSAHPHAVILTRVGLDYKSGGLLGESNGVKLYYYWKPGNAPGSQALLVDGTAVSGKSMWVTLSWPAQHLGTSTSRGSDQDWPGRLVVFTDKFEVSDRQMPGFDGLTLRVFVLPSDTYQSPDTLDFSTGGWKGTPTASFDLVPLMQKIRSMKKS